MWTYTGAAVPRQLQRRLKRACSRTAHMQLRTQQRNGAGASTGYTRDLITWLRNMLSWVMDTDATFSELGTTEGSARQNSGQVAVPAVGRMPVCEVLTFFRLIDRMQHAGIEQSANSASEKDAMLSITMSLRGHGLAASPYGIMCARTSVESVLNNWLDKSLQQLILEGQALAVPQLSSMQFKYPAERAVPRNTPGRTERYAKWPQAWTEGTLVATFPDQVTAEPMSQFARQLRRKGGTHLPIYWIHGLPNELAEHPVPVKAKDFRPSHYCAAGGWEPAQLPEQVRSVQVNTVQELRAIQKEHAWFQLVDFGGPFVRTQELSHLVMDLPSLQLAPLAL